MSGAGTERRVLDEAPGIRAMTWVMGIMLFLTLLVAAGGLGTARAARALDRQLAGRLTVQVVEGEPTRREATTRRVLAALGDREEVVRTVRVPQAELAAMLKPWLGADAADAGLPVPALIDVDLVDTDPATVARVANVVRAVSPATVQVEEHATWMTPVSGFLSSMTWLAGLVVLLMMAATGAVVMLAARAGLEAHRTTIGVMHILGSTDVQIARLFQRRIAIDAGIGSAAGGLGALAVILLIGGQMAALGSELLGSVTLGPAQWLVLALLPFGFVALATFAARFAVLAQLRRTL